MPLAGALLFSARRQPAAGLGIDGRVDAGDWRGDFHGLIGDWSVARWNPAQQALVLASDYAGVKPLYYYRAGTRVLWSSSLAELAKLIGIRPLDEVFAARFLAEGAAGEHTPYPGIRAVPSGCAITFTAARTRIERFWELPIDRETLFGGDLDYEARLLELFRQSIKARLRPHARVAAELSGGLDSSSVVTMAVSLGASLTTFSYTHPGSTDERYFRAVERHCAIDGIHLQLDDFPLVTADQTGGAAPAWWEPRFRGVARRLEEIGAGALLTGQLGDFITANVLDDSDQVAGWLRRGQLGRASREAYEWSQALRIPIYPILWRALRLALTSWAPVEDEDLSPVSLRRRPAEDSLTPSFRKRTREAARQQPAHRLQWRAAPPDRRRRYRALARLLESRRLQTPEPLRNICYTHPFTHRPLVEFLLTIPREVLCRPGQPRRLMRVAFTGLLPEAVRARRSKADYTAIYARALEPLAAEMLRHPDHVRLVEMGILDRSSLVSRLERYRQRLECNEGQLRQAILLEFWLRR